MVRGSVRDGHLGSALGRIASVRCRMTCATSKLPSPRLRRQRSLRSGNLPATRAAGHRRPAEAHKAARGQRDVHSLLVEDWRAVDGDPPNHRAARLRHGQPLPHRPLEGRCLRPQWLLYRCARDGWDVAARRPEHEQDALEGGRRSIAVGHSEGGPHVWHVETACCRAGLYAYDALSLVSLGE